MKLVIISGLSGSGKSSALQALEDIGFYCIDNLPALLIPDLIRHLEEEATMKKIAVCVDARNLTSNLEKLPEIWQDFKSHSNIQAELLFIGCAQETLIKRYSSTRRRHPMSTKNRGLSEAIEYEEALLEPIAEIADLKIDTSHMSLYDLRDLIKLRIADRKTQALSLQFESFGFKHGVPMDVDMVFDVRVLPNPYWVSELRRYSGLDQPVIDFLEGDALVESMFEDIKSYMERWLPHFADNNRSYVTVGIGCTGGQHRSVYLAERLNAHFVHSNDNVNVRHRELSTSKNTH
jgi:UPF0042 nucleotide-binding protein